DYQANLSIINILKSVNSQTKADVKDILPILRTRNERVSHEAAEAVFRLTGSYDAAADELIKVLEKGSLEQRQTAVKTLGMIGGGANKALPALNAELTKPDTVFKSDVNRSISSIMKTIEPDHNFNLDELLASLDVGTDQDIKDAANALIKATGEYQAVIDRLGEIALSDDEQLRNRGLWALGGLETHQTEALTKLHEIHKMKSWDNRSRAAFHIKTILQKIEPGSDIDPDVVLKVMESPNQEVVRYGTQAYVTLTGKYEPVVDRLIELLQHDDQYVRANACQSLAGLKGNAAKALPVLEKLAEGDVEEYNLARRYAIDEIKRGMK
ncbi:HEAT repeat domain-containing protein, partial [bacterium]|nr:HEAT repeat domain-containing protein [bacterium]MBU1025538.1 HEAT repeat domain-containing protein [bacterium]